MAVRNRETDLRLPWDILDALVDSVAIHETRSLKSLSLVSVSLVPRCRRYIFEEIVFDGKPQHGSGFPYPRPNSSRLQAFLALIEGPHCSALGPPIQDYVRTLRIENNPSPLIFRAATLLPNLRSLILKTKVSEYEQKLALEHEAFHEITEGQPEAGTRHHRFVNDNGRLFHDCYAKLAHLRLGPQPDLHLDRLYIHQWDYDSSATFNTLARCLYLQTRVWDSWHPDDIEETITGRVVTVRRLELRKGSGVLEILLNMTHTRTLFSAVEYLTVKFSFSEAANGTLRLLPVVQNTLLGLTLNVSNCPHRLCSTISASLNLESLPKLKHLVLINWPRDPEQPQFAFPGNIIALLSTLRTSPSALESIALTITWDKWDLDADWDEDGSWIKAQRLVLDFQGKRKPGFERLKTFKIRVEVRGVGTRKKIRDPFHARAAAERAKNLFNLGGEIEGGIVFTIFKFKA